MAGFRSFSALAAFGVVAVVAIGAGLAANAIVPGRQSPLVLELPPLRLPIPRLVIAKAWNRFRSFVTTATPVMLVGSLVIGALYETGAIAPIEDLLAPLSTGLLGLPPVAGLALALAILRKELALQLLLVLAIAEYGPAAESPATFMAPGQLFVFAVVTGLLVPCVATIGALTGEFGGRRALLVSGATLATALGTGAVVARIVGVAWRARFGTMLPCLRAGRIWHPAVDPPHHRAHGTSVPRPGRGRQTAVRPSIRQGRSVVTGRTSMESNPAGTIPNPDAAPRRAPRRLYRSPTNRVFSGVCAGVAEYWGGDPTMVRLATVIIGLLTGIIPMTVLYIIGAIIVPERDATAGLEPASDTRPARSGNGTLIAGIFFIVIGFLGFMHEVVGIDTDLLWPFALIGLGAGFILLTLRR